MSTSADSPREGPSHDEDTHVITGAAQLAALTSPARIEIVVTLEALGPATAGQLARRLGRKTNSLYYHIEMLEQVGLLTARDLRRGDGRTEIEYRLIKPKVTVAPDADNPELLENLSRSAAATSRIAARESARAFEHNWHVPARSMHVRRLKTRLSKETLEEIRFHQQKIQELMRAATQSEQGRLYSLTTFLVPLEPADEAWSESGGAEAPAESDTLV